MMRMVFFIDDIFLRALGLSMPPFDMIWLMETLEEYARGMMGEEIKKEVVKKIKEARLLYEFGEITREEYERINSELAQKMRDVEKVNRLNLRQRINLLGDSER